MNARSPRIRRAPKAKVYNVVLFDRSFLVMAHNKDKALRDLLEEIGDEVHSELASGQQVYQAGVDGTPIIGIDRYANCTDPNQRELDVPLPGDETGERGAVM